MIISVASFHSLHAVVALYCCLKKFGTLELYIQREQVKSLYVFFVLFCLNFGSHLQLHKHFWEPMKFGHDYDAKIKVSISSACIKFQKGI